MDVSAAVIEISSPTRKGLEFIAYSRRDVIGMLLTFPELQNDKQQATKIAQVVWDMQGKVEAKQPLIRARFVEAMTRSKGTPGRAKPTAGVPPLELEERIDSPVPEAAAPPPESVAAPLFTTQE